MTVIQDADIFLRYVRGIARSNAVFWCPLTACSNPSYIPLEDITVTLTVRNATESLVRHQTMQVFVA